ncbi:putative neural-cadherin 2 isoform X2 [Penaeus japonicus]|uniref:putative neural-cadherin 2 isoform X2 n=1 Tax=Penaeus japonicus TaxID=27405 RepID=UPI001C70D7C6|nr:putative neural-cadherin 2 isoform X2 [Penaeus japonicus]
MDPARILQIITNSTWMVTKLVGSGPVEFERSQYRVDVRENTTPDPLLQLTARVQAQGTPVEFRIKSGNEDGVFSLGPADGRLTLVRPLDFEEEQERELGVEVALGEASSEASILVRVLDENDHSPAFPRALHETQITEEDDRHLPKTILTVRAVDADAGEFGHLRYSLSGDGVFNNGTRSCFAVDESSGAIHLLRPLDRDPPHGKSQWRLRVAASDGELRAHTAVHVNLKDINDNAPYFPKSVINATISENTPEGASVAQVSATDNDDPREGHNAKLVYSLEKNVIDEASGRPIFAVDSESGLISTALCCLDREKTQRYAIQVVATDGGGLKGTGTVLVEVSDVNDVPPRFSRPEWTLDVSERLAPEHVLATLTVIDQDVSNNFTFRVVPGSGRGWQMFQVEGRQSGSPGGDLRAMSPLDYENPEHRKGFRFRVQVTDMGETGWLDKYHVDGAWVNLSLVDDNDNSPVFTHDYAHFTLPEDTPTGTLLATFTAHDIDGGGLSRVRYTVAPASDPGGRFAVDTHGTVRLAHSLDREETDAHNVLVLAIDDGVPPRTSTATLSINVTDVNDNAPYLDDPREVQVIENSKPQVVARVKLGDPDNWRQGHGPPFSIHLDPRAPPHIKAAVKVKHDKRGDEGRGVGIVSTRMPLDREERRALLVPLVVGDAASPALSATVTLTLHVADLNDNPMAPAAKTIVVHTVKPQTSQVPLGRVYVKDPDDWDAASKTYAWRTAHVGFVLNKTTGDLSMKPGTPDGRYELGFKVSDASQGQTGVNANVTVKVTSLSQHVVSAATPLTLAADPYHVVRQERKGATSILDQLVLAARAWVEGSSEGVQAVSVQRLEGPSAPSTRVWLTSPGVSNLDHVLLHRKDELEHTIGVSITDVGVGTCEEAAQETLGCLEGCAAHASVTSDFSVVDGNTSAVVGPWVGVHSGCGCARLALADDSVCSPDTCLNGGHCVPTPTGTRCICPHGTFGSRCKILSRHFEGGGQGDKAGGRDRVEDDLGGWAWVPSIPSCAEVHLSLEVLTASPDATLLYSGPDHLPPAPGANSDMLALELRGGRPSLLLDLGAGPAALSLNASYTLADSTWHRLDLIWKDELVEMIVDLCSGASIDGPPAHSSKSALNDSEIPTSSPPIPPDAHTCRGAARLSRGALLLNAAQPLQVGGLAHPPPAHTVYGWPKPILARPLRGCVRNLRINGELIDLGHGLLSQRSTPGCKAADCLSSGINCGVHGRCHGSPGYLRCECQPGWSGPDCAAPSTPTAFQVNSYVKLALSFTPLAYTTTVHLRFRTWQRRGELVVLSSQHGRDRFAVQLDNGRLCLVLQLHPDPQRSLCLTRAQVTDGQWHTVSASRYGSATFLSADDGEGDLYNASVSLEGRQLLEVDKQEGVHVGGSPEYVGVSVFKIHGDYHDGCIDDVRISGKSVPLPPAVNGTAWGQASMFKGVDRECRAPSACTNVSCRAPLTCVDTWRSYHCGCGEGRVLSSSRTACEDENECIWEPCLNGGTCLNKDSAGYVCACPTGFSGQHCHLPEVGDTSLKLSLGALVAIVVWCTFLLLLICAFLLHQHHRRSAPRRGMADVKENVMNCKEQAAAPCSHTPNLLELKLLKPPKANGQPAWSKNPNIADVDVLQVDAASVTSSMEDQKRGGSSAASAILKNGESKGGDARHAAAASAAAAAAAAAAGSQNGSSRGGTKNPPAGDDLRNYAYEGLESCSGSAKFLGGFREVAHMLESWDPTNSHSNQNTTPQKTEVVKVDSAPPITTIHCDIHVSGGLEVEGGPPAAAPPPAGYPSPLPPPLSEGVITTLITDVMEPPPIPLPIPDPPRAFKTK